MKLINAHFIRVMLKPLVQREVQKEIRKMVRHIARWRVNDDLCTFNKTLAINDS